MGFMEDVAGKEKAAPHRGSSCMVGLWLDSQTEVTSADLKKARKEHQLKYVWLTLKDRGYTGSAESVSRHLREECKCPTS